MTEKQIKIPELSQSHRHRAEAVLGSTHSDIAGMATEEAQALMHELLVHQIELEMQNEELRRVQEEMEESRSRYFDLYEFAPLGYLTLDKTGRICEVNLTACNFLVIERRLLLKTSIGSLLAAGSEESFRAHYQRVTETQAAQTCELQLRKADGQIFDAELRSQRVSGEEGHDSQIHVAFTDVTTRKQAEEKLIKLNETLEQRITARTANLKEANDSLLEGDARLQAILDHTPAIVYLKDLQGKYLLINHAYEEILNCTREDIRGKTVHALYPQDAANVFAANEQQVIDGGQAVIFEETVPQIDGLHTFLSTQFLLRDEESKPYALCGICTDISDRKQVEDTLLRIQFTIDQCRDAVFWISPDSHLIFANQAGCQLSGYARDELLSKTVPDFDLDMSVDEWPQWWEQIKVAGSLIIERRFRSKNDHIFPVVISTNYLNYGGQEFLCAFLRDITDHKTLQQEVLTIAAEEQQRIAHDLHDSLGQQLTGLSYKSETLTERLEKESSPHTALADELSQLILEATRLTRNLVQGLYPVTLEEGDLLTALEEFVHHVQAVHGISCLIRASVHTGPDDKVATLHIYRIVQEAVNNAIKHGQASHIEIRLNPAQENHVVLTVQDDGIGFPKEFQENLGLGMRSIKYRVALLGGVLEVQPASPTGTCVRCTIPTPSKPRTEHESN